MTESHDASIVEARAALLLDRRVKCLERGEKKMKIQWNRISTFVIALLMVGLVIMFAPTCYAQEPLYNVTDANEFDPDDLP